MTEKDRLEEKGKHAYRFKYPFKTKWKTWKDKFTHSSEDQSYHKHETC